MKYKKLFPFIVSVLVSQVAYGFSASGNIAVIGAPVSVTPGDLENSFFGQAFVESQNFALASGLDVDDLQGFGIAGAIAVGTVIDSYFLHFDPVGESKAEADIMTVAGSLQFGSPILGIAWSGVACDHCPFSPEYLDASDFLRNPATIYPTGVRGRGMEIDDFYQVNSTQDFYVISADRRSIDIRLSAYPVFGDQMRIITAASLVEPSTLGLFVTAFLLAAFQRRRCG